MVMVILVLFWSEGSSGVLVWFCSGLRGGCCCDGDSGSVQE